jgi:hypothetical protein
LGAIHAGAVGIITDGYCRDTGEVDLQKTPICARGRGRTIIPSRIQVVDVQTPVVTHARAVLLADMRARRKRYESLNVIWWRILLPLSAPVLIAITILSFVAHWNDFLNPLIYLFSEDKKTLALGLRAFINPADASWHIPMAASMFIVAPILIIFFIGQRYFVPGIAMTGIQGR